MAIIAPFAEAVRATPQPCTFLLIVPTLAAVIAARARWEALVGTVAAAIVGGWLLADNEFLLDGALLRVSGVAVVIATAALVAPLFGDRPPQSPESLGRPWVQSGIVAFIVLVATQWWRPCVGTELGAILSDAQTNLGGQLVPMAAYMLGAMVPVAVIVAARYALEPGDRLQATFGGAAATIGLVIALFLIAGQHESVTATLTRWTLQ